MTFKNSNSTKVSHLNSQHLLQDQRECSHWTLISKHK